MRTLLRDSTTYAYDTTAVSPVQQQQLRSPWNSPVPYMFGGLAAMLGLIAFALLVLACSYWRVSRGEDEGESVTKEPSINVEKPVRVLEQEVVVIMDGRPIYIATPVYTTNIYGMATDNIGAGGGGCTSDEEEKKDRHHSHLVINIEG